MDDRGNKMFKQKEKKSGGLRAAVLGAAVEKKINVSELDVSALVGEVAGEVYGILEGAGDVALIDLKDKMEKRGPLAIAALGWLMREGKVSVTFTEKGASVRLK